MLRAEKTGAERWWVLYGFTCAAGLYTDVLFAFTLFGHLVYLVAMKRTGPLRNASIAFVAAIALYIPWLVTIWTAARAVSFTNEWSSELWPVQMLFEKWLFNVGSVFFDLEYSTVWLGVVLIPILGAAALAALHLAKHGSSAQKWFIASLGLPLIVVFTSGDAVFHAHRSAVTRYGVLLYIALVICMAGFLAEQRIERGRLLRRLAAASILIAALACDVVSARHDIWWSNHQDSEMIPIAQRIDELPAPVVLSPASPHIVYMLSFLLKPDVRLGLANSANRPLHLRGETFVVATPDDERAFAAATHGGRLEAVYRGAYDTTWQLFHRPLKPADAAATGMEGAKFSLWRLRPRNTIDRTSSRRTLDS
jgi:hypothetical protein